MVGFDPTTFALWARHASPAPSRYMPTQGLEPWTTSLKGLRSTNWARRARYRLVLILFVQGQINMIKPLPPSAFLNPYSNSLINPRLIREKWLYSFWKYLLFLVFVLTYSTGFFQIQVRSGQCELNTRPIDLQSIALPTELYPGGCLQITFIYGALPLSYGRSNNVGIRPDGFDPSTPGLWCMIMSCC